MKKNILYISAFLGICFLIRGGLYLSEKAIVKNNFSELRSELYRAFSNENNFVIDGQLMSVYFNDSNESFMLDGVHYEGFLGTEQYEMFKDRFYLVNKDIRLSDRVYNIKTCDDNKGTYKVIEFYSISHINKLLKLAIIISNIFMILSGFLLYYLYNKNDNSMATDSMLKPLF